MSKDYADGKANLMEIIKQKEREKVLPNINSVSRWSSKRKRIRLKRLTERKYKTSSKSLAIQMWTFTRSTLLLSIAKVWSPAQSSSRRMSRLSCSLPSRSRRRLRRGNRRRLISCWLKKNSRSKRRVRDKLRAN